MTTITGYASTDKTTLVEPATLQPHDRSRITLDSLPVARYLVASGKVVTGSGTTTVINATNHGASRGDFIQFNSIATPANQAAFVLSAPTANQLVIAQPTTVAAIPGDAFSVYRFIPLTVDSSGRLTVALSGTIAASISTNLVTEGAGYAGTEYLFPFGGLSPDYGFGSAWQHYSSLTEFATGYNIAGMPAMGWDYGTSQPYMFPINNGGSTLPSSLFDAAGFSLTSATSAPAGTERGLHVRQVGSVAATQSGTWNIGSITTLPALPANQSVNCSQMNGVAVTMGNGASGTGVQRVTIASDSTGQIIANGNVAHDAVDSGNPLKVGFKARTSDPTAVANDDRVNALADKRGRQVVLVNALQENRFYGSSAADITNTTSTSVVAAGGAGVIYVVTAITVSNMSATVSTRVDILNGSTVIWRGPAASGGGGFTITFPDGLVCTANTALNAQCATTGSATRVSISGHKVA